MDFRLKVALFSFRGKKKTKKTGPDTYLKGCLVATSQ